MNKKLLIYLFSLFLLSGLTPSMAQMLTGEPDVHIEKGGVFTEFELVAESHVHNNTGERIDLNWKRVKNDIPEGWSSLVCDPITCWGPTTSENPSAITLQPDESMLLDIHVQPNQIEGSGLIEIHVWAPSDSTNVNITMTYSIDAFTVGIEDDPVGQIKVYPNPVRSNLTIDLGYDTNVRYVEVYSLIGRKMAHYAVPYNIGKYRVNASALPEGLYFVKMLNKDYEQIATRSFAKD